MYSLPSGAGYLRCYGPIGQRMVQRAPLARKRGGIVIPVLLVKVTPQTGAAEADPTDPGKRSPDVPEL
ncbi:hypothetical protein [Fibrella forsythiae]|uniref:Uncharacterized protein n=1 Tax=Fibrella forsythiae TaxID=2817061 RepID=A0ABS3JNZ1_9BACT|nr:hypothetical protein [Fibrella forsythiae]MBO0951136.1 hypothetical protein [Fibrella forsythiae]